MMSCLVLLLALASASCSIQDVSCPYLRMISFQKGSVEWFDDAGSFCEVAKNFHFSSTGECKGIYGAMLAGQTAKWAHRWVGWKPVLNLCKLDSILGISGRQYLQSSDFNNQVEALKSKSSKISILRLFTIVQPSKMTERSEIGQAFLCAGGDSDTGLVDIDSLQSFLKRDNSNFKNCFQNVGSSEISEVNALTHIVEHTKFFGTKVAKHIVPFLFHWSNMESPLEGVLWAAASKGELFNLGICNEQEEFHTARICKLVGNKPNVASYPFSVYSQFKQAIAYSSLSNGKTTYKFAKDFKSAEGVIQGFGFEMAYSIMKINGNVFHQRWTLKKGDTTGKPGLEGNYYLIRNAEGELTEHWDDYILQSKELFHVDTSFYEARLEELATELGVKKNNEVWMKIWEKYGINFANGFKNSKVTNEVNEEWEVAAKLKMLLKRLKK